MISRMKTASLAFLLALSVTCAGPAASPSLMDSMPAGHDVYLTMSPERAGIEQVLREIEGYIGTDDAGLSEAGDIIGFDPLDWHEWTEALALRPGDEIGLVLDRGQGDFQVVTFYLPSDDAAAVEELVSGIRERAEEASAAVRFIQTSGYTAVSFFSHEHDPGPEIGYHLDSSLQDYIDYSRMAGARPEGDTVLRMFADASRFPDTEGLRSVMLECTESGSQITVAMVFSTDENVPYLSVLSPEGASGEVTAPEGTNAAVRISFNMPCLKELIMSIGMDREFGMGLEEFGFSSFEELFDCFGGDLYAGVLLSGGKQGGFLQFSVRDMDAITRMLDLVFHVAAGSSDPEMTAFEFGGRNCYRTTSTESIGLDFIEFGVIGEAMVIAGNVGLEEIADGPAFSRYSAEHSLGLDSRSGLFMIADLESICESDLVDQGFRDRVTEAGIRRCALSSGYREGVFTVSVSVEFMEGNGFTDLLRFLSGI